MKQKITILGYEKKKGPTGEFVQFGTSSGQMSCWKMDEAEKLIPCVNKEVEVEIDEKPSKDGQRTFLNIQKVLFVEGNAQIPTQQPTMNSTTGEARMNKDAAIDMQVTKKARHELCVAATCGLDWTKVTQTDLLKIAKKVIAVSNELREGLE